jgi:polyhydroxyalkanoate synthesis regulator phasin
MENIKILLEEYKSLAGNTDAKSEERKNEIIAKLEIMDKDAVAEVAKPFVEESVTRLEGEVKALRSQIDAEN